MSNSLFELFKTIVIVLGIFAILHFLKQNTETMVNFDKLEPSNQARDSYITVTQPSTFQEGDPVQEITDENVQQVVVGDDVLKAEELLPKYDEANEFAQQNPVTELLKEQNYLISGYHLGINTTMQSSKIPYNDLRSLPPVPKSDWPINNSSLDRSNAFQRRPVDIGN